MITANPSHPRRSRARPRCTRTGANRNPATPKRSATMSHASRLVVTASRVTTLQLAQIDTAAEPNTAPFRYSEMAGCNKLPVRDPLRPSGGREKGPPRSGGRVRWGGAVNPHFGPPHPTLSPRPAGGEGKGRVVGASLRRQTSELPFSLGQPLRDEAVRPPLPKRSPHHPE
jgi:hypothetical protein